MSAPLLSIKGLNVTFLTDHGAALILDDIDIAIDSGAVVGLVGESGSGKSTLALSLLGLLPDAAAITAREAIFDGQDLSPLTGASVKGLRGDRISIVFQDPMTALNPLFTIGTQLVDSQRRKRPAAARALLWERATRMLERVGVPNAVARMRQYPHEFSGGMRQRVIIAMALLSEPKLLIADEPTTALDATIELQIVEILRSLPRQIAGAVLVVSHSLGLIAELCDSVVVMYAGTIVESGPVAAVLTAPRHPYTAALLACEIDPFEPYDDGMPLVTIAGTVPDALHRPAGCVFQPRCGFSHGRCAERPPWRTTVAGWGHACWLEAAE
jgi:peptide/nickel transport system ATP-binding protein